MPVPYTFGTATTSIPLSNLDANFNTPVTIGNATVGLGNTVTTVGNLTLTNATISSGNVTVTTGIFGAGSNTAPSITTTGDTNTGIFFPAADTIAFTEGGVESMRIDSSGRLGIGTSSPAYLLDIQKSSLAQLRLYSTDNSTSAQLILGSTTGASTASQYIYYDNSLVLAQAGVTDRMTIDSSGNVGIGTSSPAQKLHVAGTIRATSGGATTSAVTVTQGYINGDISSSNFSIGNYGDSSSEMRIDTRGLTTFYTGATNNATGTERMRITSAGNLLIGTTTESPGGRLTVVTTSDEAVWTKISAGASSANMISWNSADSGNNYFHGFNVNTAGDAIGSIDYNRAAGLVRYNTTSDATLKNIIGDSNGQKSVEILSTTRIREFAWKNDVEQKTQIGVIAQELHETYKGAVSVGGENHKGIYRPWGVDKTAFTFHLIAGWQNHQKLIQEQQTLIENLTTRLTALENK